MDTKTPSARFTLIALALLVTSVVEVPTAAAQAVHHVPAAASSPLKMALIERLDQERTGTGPQCVIGTRVAAPDGTGLVGVGGDAEGRVTVLTLLDPNCPHCRSMHYVTEALAEQFPDGVRLEYLAFPLWDRSLPKVEALHAARHQGLFEEMLGVLFTRQREPYDLERIVQAAAEAGLDADRLRTDLTLGTYRSDALSSAARVRARGIRSVPRVYVNGQYVERGSRSAACLGVLVARALREFDRE